MSGSLGGQYEFAPGWRAGLSLSHSERAPSIDELFANGPHGGSQSSRSAIPISTRRRAIRPSSACTTRRGPLHLTGNPYYSRFSNFIFQAPTGEIEDDLPVFQFDRARPTSTASKRRPRAKLGQALGIAWGGELQADAVHATVKDFGPAPLIPPLRMLAALTGDSGQFDGRLEVEHAFAHDRTAPLETDTAGYTMVNASLDWHPFENNPALSLSLQGNNLFDVDARRSTSQFKDFAPLAGRDIRLTARLGF